MGSLNTQNILIIMQTQDVCIHFVLTTNKYFSQFVVANVIKESPVYLCFGAKHMLLFKMYFFSSSSKMKRNCFLGSQRQ